MSDLQDKLCAEGPKGDDEKDVELYYLADMAEVPHVYPILWKDLHEWERASWRIEFRDAYDPTWTCAVCGTENREGKATCGYCASVPH